MLQEPLILHVRKPTGNPAVVYNAEKSQWLLSVSQTVSKVTLESVVVFKPFPLGVEEQKI